MGSNRDDAVVVFPLSNGYKLLDLGCGDKRSCYLEGQSRRICSRKDSRTLSKS